jgi:hypothetical protein
VTLCRLADYGGASLQPEPRNTLIRLPELFMPIKILNIVFIVCIVYSRVHIDLWSALLTCNIILNIVIYNLFRPRRLPFIQSHREMSVIPVRSLIKALLNMNERLLRACAELLGV